jgi:hypothetical protein
MAISRRAFLTRGALAALALAGAGALVRFTQRPAARFTLDGEARVALGAIVPAMLAGALPDEPAAKSAAAAAAVGRVHQAILGLPLAAQQEIQDLFGLLALAPARRFLAGVPDGWAGADPGQVAAFLQGWRLHRLALLQVAYHALHDLVLGAWYADPSAWAAIGYPGPPTELAA